MASGTLECLVKSVDYGGGTGHITMKAFFNWSVDSNNRLTVVYDHSESISGSAQYWQICGVTSDYAVEAFAQYRPDGESQWQNIMHGSIAVAICPSTTNVYNAMQTVMSQFTPSTLTKSGQLRVTYGSNYPPGPTPELPNAFPSYVSTEDYQVPIHIDIDYRPGAARKNGTFMSTTNTGGACHIKKNGSWSEMKTQDGGSGTGNPPSIRRNGTWYNQNKIGA